MKIIDRMISNTDVVYISGPMSGMPNANREAFMAAERFLMQTCGCRVLNPTYMPDGLSYRDYMAHALQLMQHATKMALLPGWSNSTGVAIELAIAERDKIPVFFLREFLKNDQESEVHNGR